MGAMVRTNSVIQSSDPSGQPKTFRSSQRELRVEDDTRWGELRPIDSGLRPLLINESRTHLRPQTQSDEPLP